MSKISQYNSKDSIYADRPAEITMQGWIRIVKRAITRISNQGTSLQCAGVAFFGFLSIFPLIAATVLIYGILASPLDITNHLETIRILIPGSVYGLLSERLESLVNQPGANLGLGLAIAIVLALWSGTRGVNALMHTLDVANHEENDRSFIMNTLVSFGLTLGALVFLAVALSAIAVLPVVLNAVGFPAQAESFAAFMRWPLLGGMVFVMFASLLRQAPAREPVSYKWLWPGAMLATALWLILSLGFSYYVENYGSYGATFGALSSAVILMLWLYYSCMVITFSAMINAEAEHETRRDTTSGMVKPAGERGAYVADNTLTKPTNV